MRVRPPLSDQVFIFTASGPEAYRNYIDTIENGFSVESVSRFLPASDFSKVTKVYGSKSCRGMGRFAWKGQS
jgi:hypothetical protein